MKGINTVSRRPLLLLFASFAVAGLAGADLSSTGNPGERLSGAGLSSTGHPHTAIPGAATQVFPINCEVDMHTTNPGNQNFDAAVTTTADDVKMQVQVAGEGPPIVLVGGGLTGWKSWEPHAEQLAATRSVVRLQLLNVQYGLEDRRIPADYSARMESSALAAALDDLDGRDVVDARDALDIVAWSYGALIALDFALDHPERVRSLTLIEPPAVWVLPDRAANDPDIQALRSIRVENDVTAAHLEQFVRAIGLLAPGMTPDELPQWSVWMEHRRSLRGGIDPLRHDDDPGRLRTFERPVLLVTGTGTAPFLRRIQDTLASLLPRARTVEMPAGHAPHIVSMDRFLAELDRFLRHADNAPDD